MNIDLTALLLQRLQPLQGPPATSSAPDDLQGLTQRLVARILEQVQAALQGAGEGHAGGCDAVGAPGAGGPVGGAGAQPGGDGADGVMPRFMAMLKQLESLFGDPADQGANAPARQLAQALTPPPAANDGGTPGVAPTAAPGPAAGPAGPAPAAVAPPAAAAPAPATAPTAAPATTPTTAPSTTPSTATSVQEAAANTRPTFKPVLRGDEATKDAHIRSQADFGRAADQAARDYGLDPNLFRAQLQAESAAFTQDFRVAMKHEGDLDRKGSNNTSLGLGQISNNFLDGGPWADGGPGNARMGSQVVTTEQYMNSPTIQLRMAASNLAQRVADHGGLAQGLAYYVSGNDDPGNPSAATYLANIERAMKNPAVVGVGR